MSKHILSVFLIHQHKNFFTVVFPDNQVDFLCEWLWLFNQDFLRGFWQHKLYARFKTDVQVFSMQCSLDNLLKWGTDLQMFFFHLKALSHRGLQPATISKCGRSRKPAGAFGNFVADNNILLYNISFTNFICNVLFTGIRSANNHHKLTYNLLKTIKGNWQPCCSLGGFWKSCRPVITVGAKGNIEDDFPAQE